MSHVVTASAGNHAQGVAYSAKALKIKATIFMPKTTPSIKVEEVKKMKSKVTLIGDNYDEALDAALKYCKKNKLTFIHPFDDSEVISGQGTIGKEILEDFEENLHAIFVAVGGGGLISGLGAYVKNKNPNVKIIAVEAEDAAGLNKSLKVGKRILNETYTSLVLYYKEKDKILVTNIDGPLTHLKNEWKFKEINNSTQLEFDIDFELKNNLLNAIMKRSFNFGLNKIADAFEKRALELYK